MKKASKTSLVITVFVIAAAIVFVGFVGIQAQMKIQVKPPADEEPTVMFSLAEHNLVTGDACGGLWVMHRNDPEEDGYLDYVEGWKAVSPDIDSYYSLQIAEVTGDIYPDLITTGVVMGGRKDDFASKTILEVWSGDPEEEANPVFRHENMNDQLEWSTRIEVGDVNGDGVTDIVLKSRHLIDIFSAVDFYHWCAYTLGSNSYFAGLALGNATDSGVPEVIVGVREYDGSAFYGFLHILTFDYDDLTGLSSLFSVTDVDLVAHDNIDYYLEDIRTYDLEGDDGILEIFSTSQARDYNYPVRKQLYSYYTHLHVWHKPEPDAVYVPLTEFAVDNLHQYMSIALFDVGMLDDGTKAVVIGTHGGNPTLTMLGWNEFNEFDELIHGPVPLITGRTGGEIWAVTLDDADGDDRDEIILSGSNASGGKYYIEIFDGVHAGISSLWNKIDRACAWVRTHITN